MQFIHSAFGYVALLSLAWLAGRRSGRLPLKTVGVATGLQFVLAGVFLQPAVRQPLFGAVDGLIGLLQSTALRANESLLFRGVTNERFAQEYGGIFALEIAGILIFVASLSRILYYYGVLPWIIAQLGRFMQRALGISSAESVGMAANIFLGMTEAPLVIRPYVRRLTESELFCLMTGGMATIAGTVMIIYSIMLADVLPNMAGHLFIASLISAPSAIAVSKLMIPETEKAETAEDRVALVDEDSRNALDAAAQGATEGMRLLLNIVAMLIAFIGLVALGNQIIGGVGSLIQAGSAWSLQAGVGVLFRPAVWLMGVSWAETRIIGELMGLKTVLNEFVAYAALGQHMRADSALSIRSFIITSYALCGFANLGSVAIMIGGIGGIAPERRPDLARLGLRSIVGGTLATMMTGCTIGFFL
jgi:concentrative nucleoside transporter, CNT family